MDTDEYVSCFNCSTSFPSGNILQSRLHECSKQSSVMNSDSSRVPVKNSTTQDIILARKARLGNLMEISANNVSLAHRWVRLKSYRYCTTSDPSIKPVLNPLCIETSTHNGVTIYGTGERTCHLSAVVDEFDIWRRTWFRRIPDVPARTQRKGAHWPNFWSATPTRPYEMVIPPSGYSVFIAYRHIPRTFCKVYVDERHLHAVFSKLKEFNICVNPRKTYLRFPKRKFDNQGSRAGRADFISLLMNYRCLISHMIHIPYRSPISYIAISPLSLLSHRCLISHIPHPCLISISPVTEGGEKVADDRVLVRAHLSLTSNSNISTAMNSNHFTIERPSVAVECNLFQETN
jgi:hypothetical protein